MRAKKAGTARIFRIFAGKEQKGIDIQLETI
jgi:hypothetical protein